MERLRANEFKPAVPSADGGDTGMELPMQRQWERQWKSQAEALLAKVSGDRFLAASVFWLKGSSEKDNPLVARSREALLGA